MEKIIAVLFFLTIVTTGKIKINVLEVWNINSYYEVFSQNIWITIPDGNFIADPMGNYSPDLRHEIAEPLMNLIYEFLQVASPRIFRNSFDELTQQQQSFETYSQFINSKNITFSRFVSDDEIIPFLDLDQITYMFCKYKIWVRKTIILSNDLRIGK